MSKHHSAYDAVHASGMQHKVSILQQRVCDPTDQLGGGGKGRSAGIGAEVSRQHLGKKHRPHSKPPCSADAAHAISKQKYMQAYRVIADITEHMRKR